MQQSLEKVLDQAEEPVTESAQQRSPERNYSFEEEKSLHQKLYDIYVEECEKEPEEIQKLKSNVNLLEKLVKRESLSCLIVNLYPGKEGYSLMLKEKNGSCSESIHLPYEEAELLEYLDAEELPPILVDILNKSQINIFHSGCVIAEIRDYRQSSIVVPPDYQSRHILLQPAMPSLACDVQAVASDSQAWSQEDKLLESQLLLATAEPLCLDPSVAVACTENRLLYNKQKVNTRPMKGNLKRYSASSLSRQQQLSGCSPPPELCMVNSCKRSKSSRVVPQYDLKFSKEGSCVDVWKQRPCDLAVPSELDVERYANESNPVKYSHPAVWPAREVKDDSGFGWKAGIQSQTTEPLSTQSLNNSPFSGERSCAEARCERPLSPTHSFTNEHSQSIMPEFKITTGSTVSLSEELAWKDTICPVSTSSSGSANLSLLSQGEETFQAETMLIPSSILGQETEYMDLPMAVLSNSEDSSSWNIFTPEQTSSFFKALSPDPASKSPAPFQIPSVEVNSVHVSPVSALSATSTISSQTSPALNTVVIQNLPVLTTDHLLQQNPALSTNSLQSFPALSTDDTQRTLASSAFNLPQRTAVSSSVDLPKTIASSAVNSSGQSLAQSTIIPQITSVLSPAKSQRVAVLSTVITSQCTSEVPTISSSWKNLAVPTVSSSRQISSPSSTIALQNISSLPTVCSSQRTPSLSTIIVSQYASSLPTVSTQKTTAISTVSSQTTPTMPTVCSTQRALILTTVSSQKNLDLPTVTSSQRIPILTTVDSSQRTPSLSAFSSSQKTVILPTDHSSQKHLLFTTVCSTQRTPTLSTAISSQRTVVLPTISSIQRTSVTSNIRSSQRTPALTTISSFERNLSNQATSNSLGLSIRPVSPSHQAQALVSDPNPMPGSTSVDTAPVKTVVDKKPLVSDTNPMPSSASVDRAPARIVVSYKALVSGPKLTPGSTSVDTASAKMVSNKVSDPNPMAGTTSVDRAPARIVVSYKALLSNPKPTPGSASVDTAPARTTVSNKASSSDSNPPSGSTSVDRAPVKIVVSNKALENDPNPKPGSTSVDRAPVRIVLSSNPLVSDPNHKTGSTSMDTAPVKIVVNKKALVSDPNPVPSSTAVDRAPVRIVVSSNPLVSGPNPMPGSTSVDTAPARIVMNNKALVSDPNPIPGSTSVERAPVRIVVSNEALVSDPNPVSGSTSVERAPVRIVVNNKSLVNDPNPMPGSASVDTTSRIMVSNTPLGSQPPEVLLRTQADSQVGVQFYSPFHPQQLVPQGPSGQDSTSQETSSPARKGTLVNLTEVRESPCPPIELAQRGTFQRRPRQGFSQHKVHLVSVRQRQPQQHLPQQQEPLPHQVPPWSTAATSPTAADSTAENLPAPSDQGNATAES